MPRTLYRLKPLTVERTKTPGRYADGGGLYLIVKPGPRRSCAFPYRRGAKATELGLGSLNDVPVVEAARKLQSFAWCWNRTVTLERIASAKLRRKALRDARTVTFEAAARNCHERHKATWRSAQYVSDWLRKLKLHPSPKLETTAWLTWIWPPSKG